MPRAFAKVNVAIWQDPDFRRLPPAAQHLYLLLWTSADLSFCGVHDWRPNRLSHLSEGFTEQHTRAVADCLIARHFIVTDAETEEVLIRSWARFDEVLKQPRLAISYVNAYTSTYSRTLRMVLVHEAKKMSELWPELPCWRDQRVIQMLEHEEISAKDLDVPVDPFGDGFAHGFGDGFPMGLGDVWPKADPRFGPGLGSVSVPPTTAATTNNSQTERGDKSPPARKRASALPEDFKPSATNQRLAEERGLSLDAVLAHFIDHHQSKGSTFVDWHAAFNTWIRREKAIHTTPRALPHASELETPPNGLSDEEYDQWLRERA